MGHQVDPLEYNKVFRDESWILKEYKKALPMLQILSSGRPYGHINETEVEGLNARIKELEKELDSRDHSLMNVENTLQLVLARLEALEKEKEQSS